MWVSKAISLRQGAEPDAAGADMGVTTIGGGSASVMTRGEQRNLAVFAPGGIVWQPRAGDNVLVIKGGVGGQEQCVVAADTAGAAPGELAPGELFLFSKGGASIYLRSDGGITVTGEVSAEGGLTVKGSLRVDGDLTVNGKTYQPCQCG